MGVISPLGLNAKETWDGLLAGHSGADRIQRFDPSQLDVQFACEVKGFDSQDYMERKEAKRADLFVQYAIGAAQQALSNAGMNGSVPDPERTGVVIGSGIGGIFTFEEQCRISIEQGPKRVSPFFVPMFIPDMASGLVSIRIGAKGPNYCTVSACASSAHAIGESMRLIQNGNADMMITGGRKPRSQNSGWRASRT